MTRNINQLTETNTGELRLGFYSSIDKSSGHSCWNIGIWPGRQYFEISQIRHTSRDIVLQVINVERGKEKKKKGSPHGNEKKKKNSYSIPKVYLAEDWVSLRAMVSFKERYRGR